MRPAPHSTACFAPGEAVEWGAGRMKAIGLENVHTESYPVFLAGRGGQCLRRDSLARIITP